MKFHVGNLVTSDQSVFMTVNVTFEVEYVVYLLSMVINDENYSSKVPCINTFFSTSILVALIF